MAKRSSRQERTRKRNMRIMRRFQTLTERDRKRIDDAIDIIGEEYCLSATQVLRILRNTNVRKDGGDYTLSIRTMHVPVLLENDDEEE
ncbi:MAG: hypothetical protein ACTTGW_01330 [Candidatus Cryptobacteroides sp.]